MAKSSTRRPATGPGCRAGTWRSPALRPRRTPSTAAPRRNRSVSICTSRHSGSTSSARWSRMAAARERPTASCGAGRRLEPRRTCPDSTAPLMRDDGRTADDEARRLPDEDRRDRAPGLDGRIRRLGPARCLAPDDRGRPAGRAARLRVDLAVRPFPHDPPADRRDHLRIVHRRWRPWPP